MSSLGPNLHLAMLWLILDMQKMQSANQEIESQQNSSYWALGKTWKAQLCWTWQDPALSWMGSLAQTVT